MEIGRVLQQATINVLRNAGYRADEYVDLLVARVALLEGQLDALSSDHDRLMRMASKTEEFLRGELQSSVQHCSSLQAQAEALQAECNCQLQSAVELAAELEEKSQEAAQLRKRALSAEEVLRTKQKAAEQRLEALKAEFDVAAELSRRNLKSLMECYDIRSRQMGRDGGPLVVNEEEVLGRGAYGSVCTAHYCLASQLKYAAKIATVRDPSCAFGYEQ